MLKENLIESFENSFKQHWKLDCLSDYGQNDLYTYGDTAKEIAKLHLLFKKCHINEGDKIAIIGKNNALWCISFLATITYGAVVVPILQDFNVNDVKHIVNHSESVLLFTSQKVWDHLEEEKLPLLKAAFSLSDLSCLYAKEPVFEKVSSHLETLFEEQYPKGFTQEDLRFRYVPNERLMLINYTSGTTGFSKGVMLSANNLAGNVIFGKNSQLLRRGERALSFLPLAHAYGCAFDFLTGIMVGTHVTLLGKTPSPKILLKAFSEVRPNIIITVPLVIEKIYKNVILPQISTPSMRRALSVPFLNRIIYNQIRDKLIKALGGRFREVIVGGAAMNPEVEQFFKKIRFPFTIGYGMTECAPLISYEWWEDFKPGTCGKVLKGYVEVRIDKETPESKIGEIQVRGENVTMGYYRNEDATKAAFTPDGWFRTGDLGYFDAKGNICIRGRLKTMILGASGQNIFPEEIEAKLNNLPYVAESLVIERNKRLVALVYPDYEALDKDGLNNADGLKSAMDANLAVLNETVGAYERVNKIQIFPTEFEKTPKRSIKRYLYNSVPDEV